MKRTINMLETTKAMPYKRRRTCNSPIFFKDQYSKQLDYEDNCQEIYNAVMSTNLSEQIAAKLIAEYGAECYFQCKHCKTEKLFGIQLRRCHKCNKLQCEFCCKEWVTINSFCNNERIYCNECCFIRCCYCNIAFEKRTRYNCCRQADHLHEECKSLDVNSLQNCNEHCRKLRNKIKQKWSKESFKNKRRKLKLRKLQKMKSNSENKKFYSD